MVFLIRQGNLVSIGDGPFNIRKVVPRIISPLLGRGTAQADNHRLPTAAAGARAQVRSCVICSGQSGTGVGFLRVLRFPLPILIPPTAPQSPSYEAGRIGHLMADVPSGLSLTPPKKNTSSYTWSSCTFPQIPGDTSTVLFYLNRLGASTSTVTSTWYTGLCRIQYTTLWYIFIVLF
jgi:hypothetical protein